MINVTFPCWASAGKCDDTYWEWDFEVSDEEYIRLKKAADGDDDFGDSLEVSDIYDRLYNEMLKRQAEVYLEDGFLLEDIAEFIMEELEIEDITDISEEQIIDYLKENYIWHIEFPDEF